MRAFFVGLPAVLIATPFGLVNSVVGAIVFAAVAGLGWQVTTPRPERGESE